MLRLLGLSVMTPLMGINRILSAAVPSRVTSRNGSEASEKRVMRGAVHPKRQRMITSAAIKPVGLFIG
jgi:hypothetical protein